jgi:hypothetical protein
MENKAVDGGAGHDKGCKWACTAFETNLLAAFCSVSRIFIT